MGRLFGTDGVRGVANSELTPELAFSLGRAGAYALTKENNHRPQIIVGMDTRVSSGMLEAALAAGMCSMGAKVFHAGVIPTPGIAYLVRKYQLDAGVVISASHNPMQDNGIKFFNREGYKLPDQIEEEIERIIESNLENLPRPVGDQVGIRVNAEKSLEDYVSFLKSTFIDEENPALNLEGLKIAVDCANGATYKAAPLVLRQLGADVHPIFFEPDGVNINRGCGSTHIGPLASFVKERAMDIGIALDGDGDRVACVDENGMILDGDQIMSICGWSMKKRGKLKKDTIVATVMSNMGFFMLEKEKGIHIEKTAVGDRYVLERMLELGCNLGGEQSGHVIFLEHNTTGDGLLTALQLLKNMREKDVPLSKLNAVMEVLPQSLRNARVSPEKKESYLENEEIRLEIEALEAKYSGSGRLLIRPSGTEALIRVMIEGRNPQEIDADAKRMVQILEERLG
ncbi:MAG: phosphoglucosamine mutase [Clostridiales bacterium]|jgi:phosphoglucosamine mutase|nr:phosphoglucosamine mutase [Clostridiales bacterium]